MIKNNLSIWKSVIRQFKTFFKVILTSFRNFSTKYPNIAQIIQLSFIYFFAVVDLMYAILNNVFSLGYLPEFLIPFFPLITYILQSPILKIWASPEKVFFMSYVVGKYYGGLTIAAFLVISSTLFICLTLSFSFLKGKKY